MKKILLFIIVLFVFFSFTEARAPLESYKRYMIVLVHGTGANTLGAHDYEADSHHAELMNSPRKSAIWDISKDDMLDKNWQGNIGGRLQSRGFLGHVSWYDFYEPWKSPIYDKDNPKFKESLSRYLGDRSHNYKNPMATDSYIYWEIEGNQFFLESFAIDYCNKTEKVCQTSADGSISCTYTYLKDQESRQKCLDDVKLVEQHFGRTAHSYWLHKLFPNDFDVDETVKYKDNNISYLELAQKDF